MSLKHKDVVRQLGEYLCLNCGKSWEQDDRDPPPCEEEPSLVAQDYATLEQRVLALMTVDEVDPHAYYVHTEVYNKDRYATVSPTGRVRKYRFEPMGPDVVAFKATITATQEVMFVYAESADHVQRFIDASLLRIPAYTVERYSAFDEFAFGKTPRIEINPRVLPLVGQCIDTPLSILRKYK